MASETIAFSSRTNYLVLHTAQFNDLKFILNFRLSNSDTAGGHYHSASGSPNKVVRGRYGSRNPVNNRLEETTYTAGPRGYDSSSPNKNPEFHQRHALNHKNKYILPFSIEFQECIY